MVRYLLVVALIAWSGLLYAAEPPPEARARAALSLAGAKVPAATAPAPRPAAVLSYEQARRESLERKLPVVVYVGCPVVERVPGAITAAEASLEGFAAGTILVCYPRDGSVWVDSKLKCPAPAAEVKAKAASAREKVSVKKTLDWQ